MMKIVKKNQMKIIIFTAVKNRCILHGRVSVLLNSSYSQRDDFHTKGRYETRHEKTSICENKGADQLCGNHFLCFRYIHSTIPLLPYSEILKLYLSLENLQPC